MGLHKYVYSYLECSKSNKLTWEKNLPFLKDLEKNLHPAARYFTVAKSSQNCRSRRVWGGPKILAHQLTALIHPEGRLCPTNYCLPLRIFIPSYDPEQCSGGRVFMEHLQNSRPLKPNV